MITWIICRHLKGSHVDAAKHACAAVWHALSPALQAVQPPISVQQLHASANLAFRNYVHLRTWAFCYPPVSGCALLPLRLLHFLGCCHESLSK
jgi:hypothetical protein